MEAFVRQFASTVALGVEFCAAVLITIGALEALAELLRPPFGGRAKHGRRREVWMGLARWLVLALEFELAADILRTAISPTWDDVGQLAAIAVIRTFLSYFLTRDIEEVAHSEEGTESSARPASA